ncbi:hypothetical protein FED53_03175 [Priestia flexa]|nr:hypothetical protein FED53_03175 [Priestia flexa]RIV10866.1 hypothetical protein D1859_09050 [Priestia flexa]
MFVFLFYAKQKQTHSNDMLILFSCTIALAAESYTIHHQLMLRNKMKKHKEDCISCNILHNEYYMFSTSDCQAC